MIDYSSWKRKKIHITRLKLDPQNPRLSGFEGKEPNQSQIIDYMIAHENIHSLAKNIANIGFLPNNEPIVYKENDKYIVLEGNRRTTACKILNDPELVAKSTKFRTFKSLSAIVNNDFVKQLSVIVAPSREAVDVLIVNVHTQGSPVERWDKTKQDRFFYNRYEDGETIEGMSSKFNLPKSAIKDSIARHNFFLEFLDLDINNNLKSEIADETKFRMTNAERFYKSKTGREFLGIKINNNGKIEHYLPKIEYQNRLKVITTELLSNRLDSRTYGDDAQQKAYISLLKKHNNFDLEIEPNKAFQLEFDEIQSQEGTLLDSPEVPSNDENTDIKPSNLLSTKAAAHKLIPPKAQNWKSGAPRIDSIFKELKDCNLSTHFNAAAILFRSYLDMIFYQFLQKKGLIKELMIQEQKKISMENDKKINRFNIFLEANNLTLSEGELKKILSLKTGVSQLWVPSLKQMLTYIAEHESLLNDLKLRQALSAYLKGNEEYLGHHDLNLLVHNEYYIKNKKNLKDTWDKLYPILDFIHND